MKESDVVIVVCFALIVLLAVVLVAVMMWHWRTVRRLHRDLDAVREEMRYNEMAYSHLRKRIEETKD